MNWKFNPSPVLAPYVQAYVFSELGVPGKETLQSLATPNCTAIVLVPGRTHQSLRVNRVVEQYESLAVVGRCTRYKEVAIYGRLQTFWIVFKPGGFLGLTGMAPDTCADNCVNLSDLLGAGVRQWHSRLIESPDPATLARDVDRFLFMLWRRNKQPAFYPRITSALGYLNNHAHQPNILQKVCHEYGFSTRNFERYVRLATDLSPKTYQKIARYNLAMQYILQAKHPINWASVACQFGFSDQSHFIKDFKLFFGKTPAAMSGRDSFMKQIFYADVSAPR